MRNTRKIQINMSDFRRDVESGDGPAAIAEKYGISKASVYRLKAEMSGKLARRESVPAEVEAEVPEAFDLTINVPSDRLDDLIGAADIGIDELRGACLGLGPQAKAELFQQILQGRLDRALTPVAIELPKLVSA